MEKNNISKPKEGFFRRFQLVRHEDVSGVSGTGIVAYGVECPNGKCLMTWNTQYASTASYDSLSDLTAIHTHEGKTEVVFLD